MSSALAGRRGSPSSGKRPRQRAGQRRGRIRRYLDWATNQIFAVAAVESIETHSSVSDDGASGKLVVTAELHSGARVEIVESLTLNASSGMYRAAPNVFVRSHAYTIWHAAANSAYTAFDCDGAHHLSVESAPYHRHSSVRKAAHAVGDSEPKCLRELCKVITTY